MAVKWTQKQKQVIDSRNRSLLVSAAAGSGKTAVLVERIICMISEGEHPLNIDQLLVMTFTSAAAAEMRERIGAAVEKRLREDPMNEHLWLQAALIPQAQIMTIDSFCLNLIRNHYNRLDIDPAFRIGDEGELTLLKGDVMEELLEECYQEGKEEFLQFAEQFGAGKSDRAMEDVILQAWQFSQSHPWPGEWIDGCRRQLEREAEGNLDESPWMEFLLRDVALQMGELAEQIRDALEVCQKENGPRVYEPMLEQDIVRLEAVKKAAESGCFQEMHKALGKLSFDRLAAARSKEIDPEKKEYVSGCRTRVKKAAEKCRDSYGFQNPEEAVQAIAGTQTVIRVLLDMAERFDQAYREVKRERNVLDFNDLEHLALEVLLEEVHQEHGDMDGQQKKGAWEISRQPSAAAEELRSQYEEILVDEYQDSNLVQETLIGSISRERIGHPNVFMVGDVKQSIYRFRLARPELFMEKYASYTREESPRQMIELQQNFRSRDTVLHFINDIFYQIMTENLGGIRYTEETALYPGASFAPAEGMAGIPSRLLFADTGAAALKQLDEDAMDYTARELEAKMIAGEIRRLTDEKEGLLVWDKEMESYRRARLGDMVILLRSMTGWSEVMVSVLMNEGIPARAQTRTGYFSTTEVETVLSLLSVIDNPMQDIPLAAVLRSPIVGMSDDEMAWMMAAYKKNAKKGQDRGVYGAWKLWEEEAQGGKVSGQAVDGQETEKQLLVGAAEIPEAQARSIWEKLEYFQAMLADFRTEARYLPIHELLYYVYRRTGYYDYVSAMPAGETRRGNLDMLVEKAAAYENTSYKGLFHFVRYIERLKKYDTDFGEAAAAGEENSVVRIMSIHKSKGLEFPVVFLAGMGKKFNRQDACGSLLLDADLGAASDCLDLELRVKTPTLKKQALKRRMELETMGEELRVLYVAMTRAKEALIMTGTDRSLESKLEKWKEVPLNRGQIPFTILSGAGSYLDWVLMAAPAVPRDHFEMIQLRIEELVGREVTRQIGRKMAREDLLELKLDQTYDAGMKENLERAFSYQYPYQADTRLYTMMSVSELKKQSQIGRDEAAMGTERGEDGWIRELEPEGDEAKENTGEAEEKKPEPVFRPGGASRGTAYHRALECLPFHKIHSLSDTKKALLSLHEQGYLDQESYEWVDPKDIWRFLESPLGERMALAQAEGRLFKEQQFMIGVPAAKMGYDGSKELVLVQGVIDAYMEEAEGLILIDYKTDRILRKDREKGAELLKERYQVQIDSYESALCQITGKKAAGRFIYSFALQKEIAV